MKKHGFTLIELLVVLAILALLAAILLPVFASVRAKGRQMVCTSNPHQIGLAIALYAQNSDDVVPFGGDAIDVNSKVWQTYDHGVYWKQAQHVPPLTAVLNPYVSSKDVWHCPADIGFDNPDFSGGATFAVHPSAFEEYGNSYGYRTELAFRQVTLVGMIAYDNFPPYSEHGTSEIDVLFDMSGTWHGGHFSQEKFNVLMGDGHVKILTSDEMDDLQSLSLDKPTS